MPSDPLVITSTQAYSLDHDLYACTPGETIESRKLVVALSVENAFQLSIIAWPLGGLSIWEISAPNGHSMSMVNSRFDEWPQTEVEDLVATQRSCDVLTAAILVADLALKCSRLESMVKLLVDAYQRQQDWAPGDQQKWRAVQAQVARFGPWRAIANSPIDPLRFNG